jgi:hypothetical protein
VARCAWRSGSRIPSTRLRVVARAIRTSPPRLRLLVQALEGGPRRARDEAASRSRCSHHVGHAGPGGRRGSWDDRAADAPRSRAPRSTCTTAVDSGRSRTARSPSSTSALVRETPSTVRCRRLVHPWCTRGGLRRECECERGDSNTQRTIGDRQRPSRSTTITRGCTSPISLLVPAGPR